MNKYELLYIVSNHYTDEEIEKISAQVSLEVTNAGGTIVSSRNIGKIRLAFPIKKQRHGTYVLVHFDAEPTIIEKLNRKLSLTEEVLRHVLTTRQPGAEKEEYVLTSYIAPLSEEARREKQKDHGEEGSKSTSTRSTTPEIAPPTPSSTSSEEQKMSIEDLDKKLEALLEADVTENI